MMHATSSRSSTCRIGARPLVSPMAVQRRMVAAPATASHGANQIKEGSKELLGAGQRAVTEAFEDAKDQASRISGSATGALGDLTNAASRTLSNSTHAAQDALGGAKDAVVDTANAAGDATKKAAQNVRQGGAGIAERAASAVKDGAAAVEKAVRDAK